MVARQLVRGDQLLELHEHIAAAHWKLIPLLGPARPIGADGWARLQLVAQTHQPGDDEWIELVAEALDAS